MSIISVNLFFLGYMYFTTASVLYICFLKRHLLSFQAILPSGEKNRIMIKCKDEKKNTHKQYKVNHC